MQPFSQSTENQEEDEEEEDITLAQKQQ